MSLIRASTGESWNGLMHDCYDDTGVIAVFFWIIFILISFFIFVNIFIAVIYENFADIMAGDNSTDLLTLQKRDIKSFITTWAEFNPNGDPMMKTLAFPRFLRSLPPPLGYKDIEIENAKLNKLIFCFNIRDHQGNVYFPEVMWSIFHSLIGNNEEAVSR
jgi:hypothetical protein